MSTLLFSLRNVPDDEADEIKSLLTVNDIDYYETSAGNWGASIPALWLKNDDELLEAQQLLNTYHQERAITQREIYQQQKKSQKNTSLFFNNFPKRITYLAASLFILYLYIQMLTEFGL